MDLIDDKKIALQQKHSNGLPFNGILIKWSHFFASKDIPLFSTPIITTKVTYFS